MSRGLKPTVMANANAASRPTRATDRNLPAFLARQRRLCCARMSRDWLRCDGLSLAANVSCRGQNDPNRELWWAHTGAGRGNFGIVTRYWFRSPNASDPLAPLPKAPHSVVTFKAEWPWQDMNEAAFKRLIANYGDWCEQNDRPDSPFAALYGVLTAARPACGGKIEARGMVTAGADSERLLDRHLCAIDEGVGMTHTREVAAGSWLDFALDRSPKSSRRSPAAWLHRPRS